MGPDLHPADLPITKAAGLPEKAVKTGTVGFVRGEFPADNVPDAKKQTGLIGLKLVRYRHTGYCKVTRGKAIFCFIARKTSIHPETKAEEEVIEQSMLEAEAGDIIQIPALTAFKILNDEALVELYSETPDWTKNPTFTVDQVGRHHPHRA